MLIVIFGKLYISRVRKNVIALNQWQLNICCYNKVMHSVIKVILIYTFKHGIHSFVIYRGMFCDAIFHEN